MNATKIVPRTGVLGGQARREAITRHSQCGHALTAVTNRAQPYAQKILVKTMSNARKDPWHETGNVVHEETHTRKPHHSNRPGAQLVKATTQCILGESEGKVQLRGATTVSTTKELIMKLVVTILTTASLCAAISAAHADNTSERSKQMEKLRSQVTSRFQKADANGDGQLTREEAKKGMPRVYKHFGEIDVEKKGYTSIDEIEAYFADQASARSM